MRGKLSSSDIRGWGREQYRSINQDICLNISKINEICCKLKKMLMIKRYRDEKIQIEETKIYQTKRFSSLKIISYSIYIIL